MYVHVPVSVTSCLLFFFFFANSFCVRTRTAENAIRGSHELEHTHAKHALAEEIGEKEGGPDKR